MSTKVLNIDVETIYSNLQDLYSREEFENELFRIQAEFADLVDREAAALFLAVEKGRFRAEVKPLSALKDGDFVSVEGKITKVDPLRTFTRKDGSTGRVVSVHIHDEKTEVRVSFWETRDIERVLSGEIKEGMILKVVNGRVKVNDFGTTVGAGNYSVVKVVGGTML